MISRHIQQTIRTISQQSPVLLITGARQIGKSTLLKMSAESDRTIVTLDDPSILELAKNEPALFFQQYRPPLLIDEIQYAPELLPYIKMQVDEQKKPGAYWLTGSQPFHLMRGVSESLAGRVAILPLLGLSLAEQTLQPEANAYLPCQNPHTKVTQAVSLPDLYQKIWRGSFPEFALNPELNQNIFFG